MRILITNERLGRRAGSDLFLRDLARGLQQLGHFVIAYTTDPREQPRLLERDAIAVATDLTRLPFKPDIIHSRHHLDAMTALVALPGVPAVHHCVGPARSLVLPLHPRLHRYLAPSPAVARWVAETGGIPDERIDVIPGAVDLSRFTRIRQPGVRTRKVLVYDDALLPGSPAVMAISKAALDLGFTIDFIGTRFGKVVDNPEVRLPDYDIVCGTGRNAAEALACGCAVFVLDIEGNRGELVEKDNLRRLHLADFVPHPDAAPVAAEHVGIAIERLSGDSSALANEARALCSFPPYVAQVEAAYRAAIATQAEYREDWNAEARAMSRYIHTLSLTMKTIEQKRKSNGAVPVSTASTLLDVADKLAAVQADLDKPQW